MNEHDLWKERFRSFWNEAIRYLRLIGNSGFMFSLYALFLAGGYFYPTFIEWIPEAFPVNIVLAILFTYLLTRCPVRTFLREGDLVFLLPLEKKLITYFRSAIIYSSIMQSISITIIFLLLGPLFQDRVSPDNDYMFMVWLMLILANFWNNGSYWGELRIQDGRSRHRHLAGRTLINAVFTYFLFHHAPTWYAGAILLIMVFVYVFYYRHLVRVHLLNWELLIQIEAKRLSAFYRFVQSFTDVPYVKPSIKRRRLLSMTADSFIWKQNSPFTVLYSMAFIRSGDYLGMYLRLLIAGSLVMYAFPSDWVRVGAAVLFLYMTGIQLKALWYHLDTTIWPDLYPTLSGEKQKSYYQIVKILLMIQTILLLFAYYLVSASYLPGFVILAWGLYLSFRSSVSSRVQKS